jgi:hypothetical protein
MTERYVILLLGNESVAGQTPPRRSGRVMSTRTVVGSPVLRSPSRST